MHAPARRIAWPAAAALLLLLLGEALYVLSLPLPDLVCAIPDDSFFYLRIAQEFWRGGGFSFDGVTSTYGFQPLWQLCMIALQPLCPDPLRLLQVAVLLCCALHVAAGGLLLRLGWRLGGAWAGLGAALAWLANPAIMVWCWGVKENALYALLWLLALTELHALLRGDVRAATDAGPTAAGAPAAPQRRSGLRLGLWLGLAVLTRVNAVSAAGVVLLVLLGSRGRGGGFAARLRTAAVAAAVAALLAAPWYLFAWLHFGTPLPTSGNWKIGQMRLLVSAMQLSWLGAGHFAHALGKLPGYLAWLCGHGFGRCEGALLLLVPLGLLARLRGHRLARGGGAVLMAAAAAALLSSLANLLCLEQFLHYADWYAVTEFVAVPLFAGACLGLALQLLPRWPQRLLLALALLAAAWAWPHAAAAWLSPRPPGADARLQRDVLQRPPRQVQLIEMGCFLRAHLPAETGVGIWDPGIVSYFRQGRCVSFDPLMNSLQYQQRFVADFWNFPARYVQEQQIAWMVGASAVGDPAVHPALPPRPGSNEPPYELVWLPYPDFDLGWNEPRWLQLVRPAQAPAPAVLRDEDFPFGVLYPNDPVRRRILTGDRDRLLAGLDWQADGVRLQLQLPAQASADLLADGEPWLRFTAADNGWQCRDARALRGRRLQLQLHGCGADAVPQAQIVVCSWR